jgi:hypothetical protein
MTASKPAPGAVRVGDLLQLAARLFRATLLKCLPLGMLAMVCWQLPNFYWTAAGHQMGLKAQYDLNFNLLTVVGTAIQLWLLGAMMLRQRAVAVGAPLHTGAELSAATRRLPVMLLSAVLATTSIAAGLLLLVVPGIYLAVCYLVWLPVVLFDGIGPYASLARSVRLIRPLWPKALTALVIVLLLVTIAAIVFAAILAALAGSLGSGGPAFEALSAAGTVAFGALFLVFLSALQLVLHSAASSSA